MSRVLYRLKDISSSLLQPRAMLVGLAVFNFSVFFMKASRIAGIIFCFSSGPWYRFENFGYVPLLLLIASLSLYFSKWWSYLVALMACFPLFYRMVELFQLVGLNYWLMNMTDEPSLALQLIFAAAISLISLVGLAKQFFKK